VAQEMNFNGEPARDRPFSNVMAGKFPKET
jgi:hypothetical protein